MIKSDNYVQISGWMITDLNLSGNELLAYALIHGFSQDGRSVFRGSIAYIQEWLNCGSRQTVVNVVKSLLAKKLVEKRIVCRNGAKVGCEYWTTASRPTASAVSDGESPKATDSPSPKNGLPLVQNLDYPSPKNGLPLVQNLDYPSPNFGLNNNSYNDSDNNTDTDTGADTAADTDINSSAEAGNNRQDDLQRDLFGKQTQGSEIAGNPASPPPVGGGLPPSDFSPPQTEFARRVYEAWHGGGLPEPRGGFISFLQCDFKYGIAELHKASPPPHSGDVIQAVRNYASVLKNPASWYHARMSFDSFCREKTLRRFLPERFDAGDYVSRGTGGLTAAGGDAFTGEVPF